MHPKSRCVLRKASIYSASSAQINGRHARQHPCPAHLYALHLDGAFVSLVALSIAGLPEGYNLPHCTTVGEEGHETQGTTDAQNMTIEIIASRPLSRPHDQIDLQSNPEESIRSILLTSSLVNTNKIPR